MSDVPFGKVPAWVGDDNCPLSGAVEFGIIAILAARRAVRRRRFFYKGVEVWLEPGHVCVSQRDLAEKLKVDRKRIRTALNNLEKLQILGPPKGPANSSPSGPVPKVFFFNVDMQLDVFGELARPSAKTKNRPSNRPNRGPTEAQQGPTSIDVKMDRCLEGRVAPARETEPQGQDPPPTQPDPEKFSMTEDWTITGHVQTRLLARFVDEIGVEGFWRQVKRFIDHHALAETIDHQAGFHQRLEGWLARANANREDKPTTPVTNGHTNGSASDGNGHDPPRNRGQGGLLKFISSGLQICGKSRSQAIGSAGLLGDEERELKWQLRKIYEGHDEVLGVKWGPNLTPDEVFARLPEFDRLAEKP